MTDNHSLLPFDDSAIEPLSQQQIEQRAPDWYETWRGRIARWVSAHADDQAAQVLLFVPDLLALVVRLAQDKRVPFLLKGQLLLAAVYVLSPFDLIPEAMLGVLGLTDDAGVLVLALMWIKSIAGLDHAILRENWSGSGDVIEVIDRLHTQINNNAGRFYAPDIWRRIKGRFGKLRRR